MLFHKIFYKLVSLNFPEYLTPFTGNSRLRSCHLDSHSIVSTLQPVSINMKFLNKSFFYRTHTKWNALPLRIRKIEKSTVFKDEVIGHFWKLILSNINNEESDDRDDWFSDYDHD